MDGGILGWLRVGLTPIIKKQMEIRVGHEMETVPLCMVVLCTKRSTCSLLARNGGMEKNMEATLGPRI